MLPMGLFVAVRTSSAAVVVCGYSCCLCVGTVGVVSLSYDAHLLNFRRGMHCSSIAIEGHGHSFCVDKDAQPTFSDLLSNSLFAGAVSLVKSACCMPQKMLAEAMQHAHVQQRS